MGQDAHDKKILLVEDDDALANVYVMRLKGEGFNVVRVANGEDALAAAKEHKPDLVVLDAMMPKVSGWAPSLNDSASKHKNRPRGRFLESVSLYYSTVTSTRGTERPLKVRTLRVVILTMPSRVAWIVKLRLSLVPSPARLDIPTWRTIT
jgi:DNA-binding NarL/FixJ family response regulator